MSKELDNNIREVLEEVYLAGWHDTAPDYANPEIATALTSIKQSILSALPEEEDMEYWRDRWNDGKVPYERLVAATAKNETIQTIKNLLGEQKHE